MEVHGADFKGNMVTYLRNISFFRMLRILCKDEAILVALGASEILSPLEFDFCVWGSYEDEG